MMISSIGTLIFYYPVTNWQISRVNQDLEVEVLEALELLKDKFKKMMIGDKRKRRRKEPFCGCAKICHQSHREEDHKRDFVYKLSYLQRILTKRNSPH
jgi:hypothetical protein